MQHKKNKYRYLFGPVASRRLKASLGIDPLPFKACTLDCIYCELGKTNKRTVSRQNFEPVEEIVREINVFLRTEERPDYLTISGSGEPTLHAGLGQLIGEIKKITSIPLAVISNATLFSDPKVRKDLEMADVVLPSLDAVSPEIFRKINRPDPALAIDEIIEGMERFRAGFGGEIWLEVMLVKGLNDTPEELEKIRETALFLEPERIQLNTVARPGTEISIESLEPEELEKIRGFFGPQVEVIAGVKRIAPRHPSQAVEEKIRAIAARRPVTTEEIAQVLGLEPAEAEKILNQLVERGVLKIRQHEINKFWMKK